MTLVKFSWSAKTTVVRPLLFLFISGEIAKWAKVVKEANTKIDG